MPIVGLTTNGASFPRIGELRKGAEKPANGNRPGADLTYFRFTSTNEAVMKKFYAIYGKQPQSVNIFLPYATTDENFEAWQEEWGAGSLKHRCDGEHVVVIQRKGKYEQPEPGTVKCPGGCKQVGRLKVIIPELGRLAYVVALTTSIWDITEVHSNLAAYEALRGDLRGIPFILSRVPRMISTPGKDGRVRREKWLWHIEAAPEWVQAQLSVMQRQALPGNNRLSISSGIDTETGEIIEPDDTIDADFDQTNPHDDDDFNQDDKPSRLLDVPETVSPSEAKLAERDDYEQHISPGDPTVADIRASLEEYPRMTGIQVADAAIQTGKYNGRDHVESTLKKHHEGFSKSGGKLSAGVDRAVALEWFDFLVEHEAEKVVA